MKAGLLVNCIGAIARSVIDVSDVSVHVRQGNTFLVCSDGLTYMPDSGHIANNPNKNETKAMIVEAKRKGGQDNISVITIRIAG